MADGARLRWLVVGALAVVCAAGVGWGQVGAGQVGSDQRMSVGSSLPATAPTGTAAASTGSASAGSGSTRRSTTKAEVEYTGGLLHVTANNSSLNQILKEVGRLTGMKITGGVQEDRVFGSYGPGAASAVLMTLLDGTASNVLIVENDQNGPAELILTPRHGGASPPNPNAAALEEENAAVTPVPPVQQSQPVQGAYQPGTAGPGAAGAAGPVGLPGGLPPSNGGQTGTPIDGGANLGVTPGAFAGYGQTPPDATAQTQAAQPAAGDGSQAAPANGVSTPQQIYEQLQKLRQQQQQQQGTPPQP